MDKRLVCAIALGAMLCTPVSPAAATTVAEAEAIYTQWLTFLASHQPDAAIAMTSPDFIMFEINIVMDRATAQLYLQVLDQSILSRTCTHATIVGTELPQKSVLLLSRLDCTLQQPGFAFPVH